MRCINCDAELRPGTRFCAKCGVQQPASPPSAAARCISCGTELRPGARFCKKCGASQQAFPPTAVVPERPPAPPPVYQPPVAPSPSQAPRAGRRWPKIVLAIGAVLVVLCVCGAGAIYLASSFDIFDLEGLLGVAEATVVPTQELAEVPTQEPGRETGTQRIGPEGGEVVGSGGAKVIVPEGSLEKEVTISIVETSAAPEIPPEYLTSSAGPAYEVTTSEEVTFQSGVELVLPLERQTGADENLYTVFQWDGSSWTDVGGFVEGDFIRVQVSHFSIFRAVYGYQDRRPLRFRNGGPYDALVSVWTYTPRFTDTPAPFPGGGVSCRAPGPPAVVERAVCRSLPLGSYQFCIEFRNDDGEQRHYIYDWLGGVSESDPLSCDLAETVDFRTDVVNTEPGPCPAPPRTQPEGGGTPAPGAGDVTVRLTWFNADDLDLHVIDPNGEEIYFMEPTSSSGGELDRDSNAACFEAVDSPVENVFWPTGGAPRGQYTVKVHYYADCDGVGQVEFRLRIMADGNVIYEGTESLSAEDDEFTYNFTR